MLGYRIDLYFHGYKLATEIDKNNHSDRNIHYENKLYDFIRTGHEKDDLDAF